MKKLLSYLLVILLPNIFIQLYWDRWSNISVIGGSIFLYFITMVFLVLFYKLRPCNMWILPFGFALPVPICYVNDTLNDSEWLTYISTVLTTVYYSLPFIIISGTIALIYSICQYKRQRSCSKRQNGLQRFLSGKFAIQELREAAIKKKTQIFLTVITVMVFLIITMIYTGYIGRKHEVRRDIIQTIDILAEQDTECIFKLSDVTKFKWDTVAYFEYPVSESQISQALGVTYRGSTDVSEGFIFVYKGRVVREDTVSIAPGSGERARLVFDAGSLTVLKKDEAVFKGTKRDETFYTIELLP